MMSAALFLCLYLILELTPFTLAGPQSTTLLPPQILTAVPRCAYSCLTGFIATSFPPTVCPNQQDLNCLCTGTSLSGFTLGEGAIRCVASACVDEQLQELAGGYNLCAAVPNARLMTHSTLTATMANPTTILFDTHNVLTTSTMLSSTSSPTSISLSPTSIPILSTSSPSVPGPETLTETGIPPLMPTNSILTFSNTWETMTTSTTISSATSSATADAATIAATSQPTLTKAQIAGVVIAGAGAALIAFGVLFWVFFLRTKNGDKKRRKRDSVSSFGDDQVVESRREPPQRPARPLEDLERGLVNGDSVPAKAQQLLGVPTPYSDRWTVYRQSVSPIGLDPPVAPGMSRNMAQELSPVSVASYRTTSQLLPEKPTYSLYPSPSRSNQLPKPDRTEKDPVRFVESSGFQDVSLMPRGKVTQQGWQPLDTSQAALQEHPALGNAASDPFLEKNSDPRVKMYAMERGRPSRPQLPRIITPTFQQGLNFNRVEGRSLVPSTLPPASKGVPIVSPLDPSSANPQTISTSSNPNFYATYSTRFTPKLPTDQSRTSAFTPYQQRTRGTRPETYLSNASETDFEDVGEEVEAVPPLPRNFGLSPVNESPRNRATKQIRYPLVPTPTSDVRRPLPESPTRKLFTRSQRNPGPLLSPYQSPNNVRSPPVRSPPIRSAPIRSPPIRSPPIRSPQSAESPDTNKALPPAPLNLPNQTAARIASWQIPTEPVELPAHPAVYRDAQRPNGSRNDKASAKWQILMSPGREGIRDVGSPSSIRVVRGSERAPPGPSMAPNWR